MIVFLSEKRKGTCVNFNSEHKNMLSNLHAVISYDDLIDSLQLALKGFQFK
jgi:hypothetical protein